MKVWILLESLVDFIETKEQIQLLFVTGAIPRLGIHTLEDVELCRLSVN